MKKKVQVCMTLHSTFDVVVDANTKEEAIDEVKDMLYGGALDKISEESIHDTDEYFEVSDIDE